MAAAEILVLVQLIITVNEELFNQNWYRVAGLRARLKQHTRIHRHTYRGKVMYVLQDHVTGQFHRFSPETYQIIGLMDGNHSLQEIWQMACDRLGDDMPTQTDMINLVSKLYRANVLVTDKLPDIEEIDTRKKQFDRKRLVQQFKSPLSIKIPLLDPEKFLRRTMPIVAPLFSMAGVLLWLAVVITGAVLAAMHWQSLTNDMADRVLALENIILIGLTYPFVKVFHELGHAYSVKRWGGEVHEIGLLLLVFFPVPYVDASSATAFRSKYQRMFVGAAGILVEMFIAGLAMILWVNVQESAFRAMLFNILLISGVSTLFFNGNPLLRYDAYYVLNDILEIPNLSMRSNQYIGFLFKRYLFNLKEISSPATSKSEATWLTVYAVASTLYRLFIITAITLFVTSKYFIFGSIIGIWFIYMAIIQPLISTFAKPMTDPQLRTSRSRIYVIGSAVLAVLMILVVVVPVPLATRAEGVIWVSEQAHVYSGESGFVNKVKAVANGPVEKGDVILELNNPELEMKVRVLKAQVEESKARYEANINDKNLAEMLREDYQYVLSQYRRAQERFSRLQVRAMLSGNIVIPGYDNLVDRYINRGQVLGYIIDYDTLPVNAMVAGDDIKYVVNNTERIEVRFASHPADVYQGRIKRITPSADKNLVSPVLSVDGGGDIALDPKSNGNRPQTYREYYHFEIDVPDAPRKIIEERAYVLFEHKPEPLARRWYRSLRRLFLRTFSV